MGKVKYYKLGIELLDKETKEPIEHIEYEIVDDLVDALDIYENWTTEEDTAKYLFAITTEEEIIVIRTDGYTLFSSPVHNNKRLATLLYNSICVLEDEYDYCIEDVVEKLGMTSEEYDSIMYNE